MTTTEKSRERQRRYRRAHPEKVREMRRLWKEKNRARLRIQSRQRYWKNVEQTRAYERKRSRRRYRDPKYLAYQRKYAGKYKKIKRALEKNRYWANVELTRKRRRDYQRKHYLQNPDLHRAWARKCYWKKLPKDVQYMRELLWELKCWCKTNGTTIRRLTESR